METTSEGQNKDYCDEARRLFTNHFHQPPSWKRPDYIQLADLRRVRPDLSLAEFSRRFSIFLASPDAFHQKQGGSLGFFCSKFDQFIVTSGNGHGWKQDSLTQAELHRMTQKGGPTATGARTQ